MAWRILLLVPFLWMLSTSTPLYAENRFQADKQYKFQAGKQFNERAKWKKWKQKGKQPGSTAKRPAGEPERPGVQVTPGRPGFTPAGKGPQSIPPPGIKGVGKDPVGYPPLPPVCPDSCIARMVREIRDLREQQEKEIKYLREWLERVSKGHDKLRNYVTYERSRRLEECRSEAFKDVSLRLPCRGQKGATEEIIALCDRIVENACRHI